MEFQLTSDQETFRDAARGFAERHLRPEALASLSGRRPQRASLHLFG